MRSENDNVTSYFLICSKNLKAVYLSFHGFNDSRTRKFKLVTRGFELVTRGFVLVTRGFELVTRVLLFHCTVFQISSDSCLINLLYHCRSILSSNISNQFGMPKDTLYWLSGLNQILLFSIFIVAPNYLLTNFRLKSLSITPEVIKNYRFHDAFRGHRKGILV